MSTLEDYETDIEKRWWLRGVPETNDLAPSLSDSIANRRACRATPAKDFDDKMGDPQQMASVRAAESWMPPPE